MRPTIFVVEDQTELRESICEELERAGFTTVGAPHGERALALLHRVGPRPALMLLDLLLPHKDGWEVVASMKADPKLRDVPIVVMSAVPPQATSLQAQGVAATLSKPFTMEELLFVVLRFVQPEKARPSTSR
ncbi:MAG TPA: response regulator [Myxococcales bacterium]|nr:response regulator [Myxococcales bacterium]